MRNFYKFITILLLVSFGSSIVWLSYRPYLGIDDAYIYFVYAKNLATGHGFVYNIGGERVEGFTSMLWVLVCTLCYKLTAVHFRQILMVLNILLVSFSLFRITDFIDRRFFKKTSWLPSFPSICLLAILFTVKGYLDWTIMSLLETGLWSSCLILITVSLLELCYTEPSRTEPLAFGTLLLVLVLTRPESLLLGVVFLTIRLLLLWQKNRSAAAGPGETIPGNSTAARAFPLAFRASVLPAFFFAATFAGLVLFRLRYFGYPFPNTYYAKVSSNSLDNAKEGVIYFFKFLYVYPIYWIPLLMLLVSLWSRLKLFPAGWKTFLTFRDDELAQTTLAITSGIAFLIPMMVGGDHFSLFRIYQPFAPIFLVMLLNVKFIRNDIFDWQLQKLPGMPIPRFAWLLALLPVAYLMNIPKYFVDPNKVPYKLSLLNDFAFPYSYRQVSGELNSFFDFAPKPSIGRIWAGAYAFGYDGPTVDLMGLNNTLMAHASRVKVGLKNHASFDKGTFYKLRPDFVDGYFVTPAELRHFELPENTQDFDEKSFESGVLKGIFRDSAFIRQYQPVMIRRAPWPQPFFTYARVDYIDTLRQKNFQVDTLQRKRD